MRYVIFIVQWLIVPVAVCAVGYYLIGPYIGQVPELDRVATDLVAGDEPGDSAATDADDESLTKTILNVDVEKSRRDSKREPKFEKVKDGKLSEGESA